MKAKKPSAVIGIKLHWAELVHEKKVRCCAKGRARKKPTRWEAQEKCRYCGKRVSRIERVFIDKELAKTLKREKRLGRFEVYTEGVKQMDDTGGCVFYVGVLLTPKESTEFQPLSSVFVLELKAYLREVFQEWGIPWNENNFGVHVF